MCLVINNEEFSYDPNANPSAKQLKNRAGSMKDLGIYCYIGFTSWLLDISNKSIKNLGLYAVSYYWTLDSSRGRYAFTSQSHALK